MKHWVCLLQLYALNPYSKALTMKGRRNLAINIITLATLTIAGFFLARANKPTYGVSTAFYKTAGSQWVTLFKGASTRLTTIPSGQVAYFQTTFGYYTLYNTKNTSTPLFYPF